MLDCPTARLTLTDMITCLTGAEIHLATVESVLAGVKHMAISVPGGSLEMTKKLHCL